MDSPAAGADDSGGWVSAGAVVSGCGGWVSAGAVVSGCGGVDGCVDGSVSPGPLLTTIITVVPLPTETPLEILWLITWPAGTESLSSSDTLYARPAARSISCASPRLRPAIFGTVTRSSPILMTISMVLPLLTVEYGSEL